ncbi:flagellar biosynthesis protein [Natronobacillus azotifigens]|uniref:EscU/YscU/HrcU family type III secretion system export apparatus switch protein n=1 Tax=Natronobacillus azotifigens TaxID=472978 RepID=A0A9J6RDK8_9BACI|nr:EscU/YscU/HrcU family type III secretion system export apparatus switch protein [Natronobacillus azotifigens]MCZ0703412.1 EscU/YscU/HrcU family type III secretion system export apparatus switch protein [Natronobacillus azotifigens]
MSKSYRNQKAVALQYDKGNESAPKVSATGKGYVAQQIIDRAAEANVPIQKDTTLVELLAELNINEKIPEDLYQAVAEVFAYIYQVDRQQK